MTKAETLREELFTVCPDFASLDKAEWDLWTNDDGTFSVHQVFAVFSGYISERLERREISDIERVFRFIEMKLGSDEEMNNAACTCFLENIMNRVPESIDPETFVDFLGPKSRGFCKAWDDWCGMKTKGL